MPSVSFSVELSVDDRLTRYKTATNRKKIKNKQLISRADTIDDLLKKVGY